MRYILRFREKLAAVKRAKTFSISFFLTIFFLNPNPQQHVLRLLLLLLSSSSPPLSPSLPIFLLFHRRLSMVAPDGSSSSSSPLCLLSSSFHRPPVFFPPHQLLPPSPHHLYFWRYGFRHRLNSGYPWCSRLPLEVELLFLSFAFCHVMGQSHSVRNPHRPHRPIEPEPNNMQQSFQRGHANKAGGLAERNKM